PAIDTAADIVRELAFEQMRNPARELDHLDAPRDFTARVGEHLAMLARDDRGEIVDVLVEQRFEFEQHTRALQRRCLGPCRQRAACRLNRSARLLLGSEADVRAHATSCRVEHCSCATGRAGAQTSIDEMTELCAHRPTLSSSRGQCQRRDQAGLCACGRPGWRRNAYPKPPTRNQRYPNSSSAMRCAPSPCARLSFSASRFVSMSPPSPFTRSTTSSG